MDPADEKLLEEEMLAPQDSKRFLYFVSLYMVLKTLTKM